MPQTKGVSRQYGLIGGFFSLVAPEELESSLAYVVLSVNVTWRADPQGNAIYAGHNVGGSKATGGWVWVGDPVITGPTEIPCMHEKGGFALTISRTARNNALSWIPWVGPALTTDVDLSVSFEICVSDQKVYTS